jgi:hypothetical protein
MLLLLLLACCVGFKLLGVKAMLHLGLLLLLLHRAQVLLLLRMLFCTPCA